eukprot:scaffold282160_cov31-Tisochrysis_lutea.AAC.4
MSKWKPLTAAISKGIQVQGFAVRNALSKWAKVPLSTATSARARRVRSSGRSVARDRYVMKTRDLEDRQQALASIVDIQASCHREDEQYPNWNVCIGRGRM